MMRVREEIDSFYWGFSKIFVAFSGRGFVSFILPANFRSLSKFAPGNLSLKVSNMLDGFDSGLTDINRLYHKSLLQLNL